MIEMDMSGGEAVVQDDIDEVLNHSDLNNHSQDAAETTPNHLDNTNEEEEKVSPSSPLNDDFLTIVPKPTLLGKEKAKKRLLAFGLSKFSNFQNTKKKLADVKKAVKGKDNQVVDGAKDEGPTAVKKLQKKHTHADAARETVEAIEKYKQEEVNLLMGVKQESRKLQRLRYGTRKRRFKDFRDKRLERGTHSEARRDSRRNSTTSIEKRPRDNERRRKTPSGVEKRSSYSRDQVRKSSERRSSPKPLIKEKDKPKREKKSWSDYEEDFCEHPANNEINNDIVDVRKMLLFNSACYNFNPFPYKKPDGSIATVSAQFLRYTVKTLPRVVYSPNPSNSSAIFFQRKDVFSIISKPQKDCVMNLISQAQQAEPISPHKPQTTRTWYPQNFLAPYHEDDTVECAVSDDLQSSKRDKSGCSKRKYENEEDKSKRRKEKKKKHKHSHKDEEKHSTTSEGILGENLRLNDDVDITSRKHTRTDSYKSDTNPSNSIDNAPLNNCISSQEVDENSKSKARITSSLATLDGNQVKEDQLTPPVHHSSPISNKHKSRTTHIEHREHSTDKHINPSKEESKTNKDEDIKDEGARDSDKHNISQNNHRLPDCNHKDYSKKSAMMSVSDAAIPKMGPTRIYKIENDCLETVNANKWFDLSENEMSFNAEEAQPVETKPKPVLPAMDVPEKRPMKETPIEKLKTKPSELYSPTLRSISNDSSDNDAEMPDTDEYKSHWESEEELSNSLNTSKSFDNSWESDEEYPYVVERVVVKPKEITERSLEMPLNINFGRKRRKIVPMETQTAQPPLPQKERKQLLLFEDLDGTNSWDTDTKQTSFELKPDLNIFSGSLKTNLEDEYIQFMSSVLTIEESTEQRPRSYSSSSSASSTSSSSSSSDSYSSSSIEDDVKKPHARNECDFPILQNDIDVDLPIQNSPICKVDSTSSPALAFEENKMYVPKPIATIIFPKKSPLVGCSLFKDDSNDNDGSTYGQVRDEKNNLMKYDDMAAGSDAPSRNQSPGRKRSSNSRSHRGQSSHSRSSSPSHKIYSNRDRLWNSSSNSRDPSPKLLSPRHKQFVKRSISPRRPPSLRRGEVSPRGRGSPKVALSPRRLSSPRRTSTNKGNLRSPPRLQRRAPSPRAASPKSRDSSPRRRDHDRREGRRRDGTSPRRRSPKLINKEHSRSSSPKHDSRHRSPKHRDRSPRSIDLARHRDYEREKNREGDITRHRDDRYNREHKYRDGSPRYRESPIRYSPARRRSPPRNRYSPKLRDRSPRYRDRSPWRRSMSPPRRMYSRPGSKDRKHESITQALHRLAGMDYEPPKSPTRLTSPMEGYIRGVPDSTISDEQLMQNRIRDFNSTQSPIYFGHLSFKPEGSPKRIPLDDRINQVLGIDAPKGTDNITYPHDHYYNQMYYDQYNNMSTNHSYEHGDYKHYDRHLIDVNNVSNQVVQVGNVLQVVPTETEQQQQLALSEKKDDSLESAGIAAQQASDSSQKFVHVGNMLQIVPSTELPSKEDPVMLVEEVKQSDDPVPVKINERQLEREKRRQERDRRRKEKEMKKKEREHQKLLKLRMKSEDMIKNALMVEVTDEIEQEIELKSPVLESGGTKVTKGILVIHNKNSVPDGEYPEKKQKQKKGVKFADGVLPGEGTSTSGGEELSSPPPYKEKRYTKTKKPKRKQFKKKIRVQLIRKTKKKDEEDDDSLPPPSPPPGSPPPHIFPPRIKPNLYTHPPYYSTYQYNVVSCPPIAESSHTPYPNIPGMQYAMSHLQSTPPPIPMIQTMHPLPILLQQPSRLLKASSSTVDKSL